MRIELVRQGGIAGLTLRGAASTEELPSDLASKAEAALRRLPTGRPPSPPRHPDGFQYAIVMEGGSAHTIVLDEADVPDSLRPLVDLAVRNGRIE